MRPSRAQLMLPFVVGLATNCAPGFTGTTQYFDIASRAVADSFTISVWLPSGYSTSAERHPTLFQLDGETQAEAVATFAEALGLDLIVVGISAGSAAKRFRDYTPSEDARFGATTGGAAAFSTFLSGELIPHLEVAFRASPHDRALMGHSLAGLAVVAQLLSSGDGDAVFTNFGAASPSLWWDSGVLLRTARDRSPQVHANLFIGTGDVESTDVVFYSNELVTRLTFSALTVRAKQYENTGHSWSWEKVYPDALDAFYGR